MPSTLIVLPSTRRHLGLRAACATAILTLGAVQAWLTRFSINPDGISYLDIGDAYWRGDWHDALNAYWSPLYSWILGFFVNLFRPTPYWEYPLLHFVNLLILAAVLACFDFFLATLIADRRRRDLQEQKETEGLAESSWWLLGYGLFACSSLVMVGLFRVCPDLCVAGLFYLAAALIIKIRSGAGRGSCVLLGFVLGLAYLAKAVMFPLAFVFLAMLIIPKAGRRKSLQNVAIATLVFLVVAAPLCTAISLQKQRLTFGESGAWNYSLYVNGMRYWETDSNRLEHPIRRILDSPPVYEFGQPIAGTYPPWYDPTYWHAGAKPYLAVRASLQNVWGAAKVYGGILGWIFLNALLGLCILVVWTASPVRALVRWAQYWPIAVPSIATLALYSPVHTESRFVATPVTILLLIGYAALTHRPNGAARRFVVLVVAAVAISSMLLVVVSPKLRWPVSPLVFGYPRPVAGPEYAEAAVALRQGGLRPGDTIGLVWNEKWAHGAVQGAYVPRLLRLKIVAEATDADGFWQLHPTTRSRAIQALRETGVRALLAKRVPANCQDGWSQLASTEYFVYWFPRR